MSATVTARIIDLATRAGAWIATVESCTGGLIAHELTQIAGCSASFWGGAIAYDTSAKQTLAGVDAAVLERHGAVSRETAIAMAEGGLRGMRAALGARATGPLFCVSTTGIAGPTGGTATQPVGLCWIGLAVWDAKAAVSVSEAWEIRASKSDSREANKRWFADEALRRLLDRLTPIGSTGV